MENDGDTRLLFKTRCFHDVQYNQLCPLGAAFIYRVKRGNFGITAQKYPHTQQHNTQSPTPIFLSMINIHANIARGASFVLSSCCLEIGDFLNLDNALTLNSYPFYIEKTYTNVEIFPETFK